MPFLTIAATAASLATGVAQTIKGVRDEKKAQEDIDNYLRQGLTNTLTGIATPQMGYNLGQKTLLQAEANAYDQLALSSRGAQMTGQVYATTAQEQEKISAAYEESLYKMALDIAKENMRLQQMAERREEMDLAGLGSEVNAARQTTSSGIGNVITGITGLAGTVGSSRTMETGQRNSFGNMVSGFEAPEIDSTLQIKPY